MEFFGKYFLGALKARYFSLSGRAPLKEFWFFAFSYIIWLLIWACLIPVLTVGTLSFLGTYEAYFFGRVSGEIYNSPIQYLAALLLLILVLAPLPPLVAILIRRLHDVGRSGFWTFLALVPIGGFALLFFTLLDSRPGPNKYGENPREAEGLTNAAAFE